MAQFSSPCGIMHAVETGWRRAAGCAVRCQAATGYLGDGMALMLALLMASAAAVGTTQPQGGLGFVCAHILKRNTPCMQLYRRGVLGVQCKLAY